MEGLNRVCLLSAHRSAEKRGDVAKGGRILERRSGDPEMESPAGKKATGRDPANGKAVNWR
jgi:hypothetical protein